MKSKLFIFSTLAAITMAGTAMAQQNSGAASPIFIKPYVQKQNTYTSNIPTVVQARPQQQSNLRSSATQSGSRFPEYKIVNNKNPFAGTGYGRIKSEKDYFDKQTGKYVGQYEYMALLNQRGETGKLNSVRSYLQQNGVFDPAKYQAAMMGGTGGAGQQQAAGNQPAYPAGSPSSKVTATGQPRVFVQKQDNSAIPKKLHNDYDNEPAVEPSSGPRPIFLR